MRMKVMAGLVGLMLAIAIAPATAFAALVAPQGTQTDPGELSFGETFQGQVTGVGDAQWYRFATTSETGCYDLRVACDKSGESALVELYDDAGNAIGSFEAPIVQHRYYLLKPNADYRVKVESVRGATFSIAVFRTDAPLTVSAKGANSAKPRALAFGKTVRSQFRSPSPDTRDQSQWFSFSTDKSHSIYSLKLVVGTDNQQVSCTVLEKKGKQVASMSATDQNSLPMLLERNTTYIVKVSADYTNKAAYPKYRLTAYQTLSKPKSAALGKKERSPYALKLGQTVTSQFDAPSAGTHDQWFTFTTTSKARPYAIAASSRTKNRSVAWSLYEPSGWRVASSSTTSTSSKTLDLAEETTYTLKVSSNYSASTGYPTYRLCVAQLKPGAVPNFQVSAGARSITVSHGTAKTATAYQIAYREAGAKRWDSVTTSAKQRTISRLASGDTYVVRIRSVYRFSGVDYFGSWSKPLKATVR